MAIKTGIIGAAGFAGVELIRLALQHPQLELLAITSNELEGKRLIEEYPQFTALPEAADLCFSRHDCEALSECELVFLAVPHTGALAHASRFVSQSCVVVDLSADFRLSDAAVYEEWYGVKHTEPELLAGRAFGLPELFPEGLERLNREHSEGKGVLVGCAGCYPTATSLAAAPAIRAGFLAEGTPVIVDAISGVTGAGKKATARTHYCFASENLEAYGVATHRHTPEIEQILGVKDRVVFTPHLAPLNRGLLSTVNIQLADEAPRDIDAYLDLYRQHYAGSPFVTVLDRGVMPKTSSVAGTNCAQVGLALNTRAGVLIAVGAIDNLGKGAAGQAMQCANLVLGFPKTEGLNRVSVPL